MNYDVATPRPRFGGFPQTPATVAAPRDPPPSQKTSLPPAPENVQAASPVKSRIPTTIIDAPQQRFYVAAIYVASWAYRLWDWGQMLENQEGPYTYFFKWIALDLVFFYSLPWLRIPWLEFSAATASILFFVHFLFNWALMFRIPLPIMAGLLKFVSNIYDRELSISENSVRASSIVNNRGLISGKQIINILPEGSATLNPAKEHFCLGEGRNAVTIPLYFNTSIPASVDLVRVDLQTNKEETVSFSKSQIREIKKLAGRCCDDESDGAYRYNVPIKATGAYRLERVLDEHQLQVQRISDPTYVVSCPTARIPALRSTTRCIGDLSDLVMEVTGTPPLEIYYNRSREGQADGSHYQYLQPDGFSSPLLGSARQSIDDVSWLAQQKVEVRLNETMLTPGHWQYSINQVIDALGNKVKYDPDEEQDVPPKNSNLFRDFSVKKRPMASLQGCDQHANSLNVARGSSTKLPIKVQNEKAPASLTYQFSPYNTLTKSGDHGDVVSTKKFSMKGAGDQPVISEPGLYTLKSVTSDSCEGEIQEPSSCLLLNPMEPTMSIKSEAIAEKCAGNPIGLRVDLDFTGTPPFTVEYHVDSEDHRFRGPKVVTVTGLRQQIELSPKLDGHYKYTFTKLQDSVYKLPLPQTETYVLEQYVKPPASAYFLNTAGMIKSCLGEKIAVDVRLEGDGPFTLEWELVHDGRRKSKQATDITGNSYTITTAPLTVGGEYTLALKTIKDKTGCPVFLKEETKITVRRQEPRASFGLVEGKRSVTIVEGETARIPLRISSGDNPFQATYRHLSEGSQPRTHQALSPNDYIEVKERGTYELLSVRDDQCPGSVETKATRFEVDWFPRPELSLLPSDTIYPSGKDIAYTKKDICAGDIDGFDIALKGSPPFHVEYTVRHKPRSGTASISTEKFDAAASKASRQMKTSLAGKYTYAFSALSDNLYYNGQVASGPPVTLEQTVHPNPTAEFVKPGQTFKLCTSDDDSGETIPIKLQGKPPFNIELEIKHHATSFPETFPVLNIEDNTYAVQVPRQHLKLGLQQIRIRRVSDSRGCHTDSEQGGQTVQVHLFDAPAIYPMETRTNYCVGERISYTLSGTPPFEVTYDFDGQQRKAKAQTTNFRRIAENPGEFTITSVGDRASECRASVNLAKTIHPMPSVRISQGKTTKVDIHEGSEVEIHFDFGGTPPFEFTYTRSTNARKGQRSQVLETRHDISYEHKKVVQATLEGTYEVVAIKDAYCSYSMMGVEASSGAIGSDNHQKQLKGAGSGGNLLTF